ncbi:hypothetical protein [Nocardia sp. NPDC005998]|uniref:hypothetical protein n=1 Tax=Nocardia sp. NPDC005998 TaxID=3156894 RepID=UPI0033A3F5C7
MPNDELPQRIPFTGPPVRNWAAPGDLVELFANALNQWKTAESPPYEITDPLNSTRLSTDEIDREVLRWIT